MTRPHGRPAPITSRASTQEVEPTLTPSVDPRLIAIAVRIRSLRVELDRVDDALSLLDRDSRSGLNSMAAVIRDGVDEIERRVERQAAGL